MSLPLPLGRIRDSKDGKQEKDEEAKEPLALALSARPARAYFYSALSAAASKYVAKRSTPLASPHSASPPLDASTAKEYHRLRVLQVRKAKEKLKSSQKILDIYYLSLAEQQEARKSLRVATASCGLFQGKQAVKRKAAVKKQNKPVSQEEIQLCLDEPAVKRKLRK
jgi:hypothetical protein